ncbi:UNVERIFIED_CONTAM: hypothetical protein RMT77_012222 [Armadillidium vulgare]
MKATFLCLIFFSLAVLTLSAPAQVSNNQRQKRVSDQRLAELETLLALAAMKNRKYMNLPVGFGLIDVQQIGRRKRSALTPLTQFVYPHEINELSLKNAAMPFKFSEIPLKSGASVPYASPIIVDALQAWERSGEPNIAVIPEGENYV